VKYYERMHMLEISFENKFFFSKNKVHLYRRLKKIIDESKKPLKKLNVYKITKNNYHLKETH
jgi:hypothetical protein